MAKPPTNLAAAVIAAFGGPTAASKALGLPISTVDSWQRKGRIPAWRIKQVAEAASATKGVELPANFPQVAA